MASEAKGIATDDSIEIDDIEVIAVNIDDPDLDPVALGFASREEFDVFVKEGLDDIEAGRVIPHEQVMAEMRALIDSYRM